MSFLMLNIAQRSLASQELAMEVTGQNLTNATTPGYHRESAVITEAPPVPVTDLGGDGGAGQLGEGTTVSTIQRASDAFLSHTLRTQMSQTGMWDAENTILSQIQNAFQEPSSSGLEETLNHFFASYNALSQDPSNPADQSAVMQQGKIVAQTFNQMATTLTEAEDQMNQSVASTVAQVNTLSQNIASLNQQIAVVKGAGEEPNDLENQRSEALDQLSRLVNVSYTTSAANGAMNVYIGSQPLVAGTASYALSTTTQPAANGAYAATEVTWADPGATPPAIGSGKLAGLLTARDQHLASYQTALSALASDLETVVQSSSQYSPGLFSSSGSNAAATLTFTANSAYNGSAPGANQGILALYQQLVSGPANASTSGTLLDQYTSLVDQVGTDGQNAATQLASAQTTETNLSNSLSSQVGVDINQESAQLIQEQQSYSAAAQIVSAEQATMQSLLQAVS